MASRSSGGFVPATDSRRSELLRIAADVFSHAGYSRTSLRDVADAAGLLTGSLYHHFPSKESLANELISAFHVEIDALANLPRPVSGEPLADIAEFADEVAQVAERHRAAVHMCMYDAPSTATEAMRSLLRHELTGLDLRWAALLDAASAAGALRPEVDLPMLRFALRNAVFDLAPLPNVASLTELVEALTSLLLHGLAPDHVPFSELDRSGPTRIVTDIVASWAGAPDAGHRSRRVEILAAARNEFARRGYEATTVRDIAAVVEIRPSSLYRHFESKQDILDAIMERFSRLLLDGFEAVVGSPGSAVEKLDAIMLLMASAAGEFWQELVIVKDWWRMLNPSEAPPVENAARLRLLESVVEDGIASGELVPPKDPALLTLALRSVLWLPLQDTAAEGAVLRRHEFLRRCVLDGAAA